MHNKVGVSAWADTPTYFIGKKRVLLREEGYTDPPGGTVSAALRSARFGSDIGCDDPEGR